MSQPPVPPPQQPWGQPNPWAQSGQANAGHQWGAQHQPPPGFNRYVAPPKPGVIPLRPLGLGEILDGAFQACRKNAMSTFGSAVLVQVLLSLLTIALLGGLLLVPGQLENLTTASDSEAMGWVASVLGGASILSLVNVIAVLILQGVLVIPVARAILNLRTSFGQMWKIAGRKIFALIGLGVLMIVAAVLALGLFVLLMVLTIVALEEQSILIVIFSVLALIALVAWISVKFALAPAALILDGTGIFASLGRSWTLVKGNWWRTFGILLLTTIIVQVIASVISAPISFLASLLFSLNSDASSPEAALAQSLPLLVVSSLITAVFAAIGLAFQAAVTALLYVDLRIRREGFDITLMKEHESAELTAPDFLPGDSVRRLRGPSGAGAAPGNSGPWPQQ